MTLINFKLLADSAGTQIDNIKNPTRGTAPAVFKGTLENVIKLYVLDAKRKDEIGADDENILLQIHAKCFDELNLEKNKRLSKEEVDKYLKIYLEGFKKSLAEREMLAPEISAATQPVIKKPNIDIHDHTSAKNYYLIYVQLNPKMSAEDRFRSLSATISSWLDVVLLEDELGKHEAIPNNEKFLVNSLNSAVDVMNYEQILQTLIKFNFKNKSVAPYICDILKTKMQKDANFAEYFNADSHYAPILAHNNIKVGDEFPNIKNKPRDLAFEFSEVRQGLEIGDTPVDDMQHDIINVGVFLRDNLRVQEQLIKLEKILESRAEMQKLLDKDNRTLSNPVDNPGANKKFLSGYFKEWLKENGFAYTKLEEKLDISEFRSKLTNLSLFKDKEFGLQLHGEWTHMIQWWCLIEANRDNPFLKNTPQELYRWLGSQKEDMWFHTFEQPNQKLHTHGGDFRGVGNFSNHLTSPELAKTCPLLQQLISTRVQKREAAAKSTPKF